MHRTAHRRMNTTRSARQGDDLMALVDATTKPRPTAESMLATVLATANPAATTGVLLEAIHALDGGPLTVAAATYLPVNTLLNLAGLDVMEIDRAELPQSVRTTYTGMLVQPLDGRPFLLLPRHQDQAEREQVIRRLAWQQANNPTPSGQPFHLPGSKPVCEVRGCQNDHLPDPDSNFETSNHHFGATHTADDADGRHVLGAWFEINTDRACIKVETFNVNRQMNVPDGRAFADQLRRLAAVIDSDLDTIEATRP